MESGRINASVLCTQTCQNCAVQFQLTLKESTMKKKKIHISIETKCYIPEPLKGLLTAHHRCQTDA